MNKLKQEIPEYGLFYPQTDIDLRTQYPELRTYDEFKILSTREMLLCWYMANKTSPFYYLLDSVRTKRALEYSGYTGDAPGDKFTPRQLQNNDAPSYFKKALAKMATFEPDVRKDILSVLLKIVEHAKNSVNEDITKFNSDATKLKAFNDMCMSIGEKLPNILKNVEGVFGISDFESNKSDNGTIDIFAQK